MKIFFKIDDELFKVLPNNNFGLELLSDTILMVQHRYLKPLLGGDFLSETLDDVYLSETEISDERDKYLIRLIQRALGKIAFAEFIPQAQVQIDSSGVHIISNEHQKTAFDWQIDQLQESLFEEGFSTLNELLDHLEDNKDYFQTWTNGEGYEAFNKYFVRNTSEFEEYYNLNKSHLLFLAMTRVMGTVERFEIESLLGEELFAELRDELKADNLSADNLKILPMIQELIVYRTIAEALPGLSIHKSVFGISKPKKSDKKVIRANDSASLDEMYPEIVRYRDRANAMARKLIDYLNDKIDIEGEVYENFQHSPHYVAPTEESKTTLSPNYRF